MSIQCTIVASDTAPVKEVIKDGYNGILTDFYDIDGIVNKVNDVLDNREKYGYLGENARKTAVSNYDLKKILPKYIEFLNKVANK